MKNGIVLADVVAGPSVRTIRLVRTLFLCEPHDESVVHATIRDALHASRDWRVVADRERDARRGSRTARCRG